MTSLRTILSFYGYDIVYVGALTIVWIQRIRIKEVLQFGVNITFRYIPSVQTTNTSGINQNFTKRYKFRISEYDGMELAAVNSNHLI